MTGRRTIARGPSRGRGRGFTLIELMVVIALIGLLLTLAMPAFENVALGSRLADNANRLSASMSLARGEAIKRNATTAVCRSANGTSCATAGTWEQGWIVFADTNGNGAVDTGESVLHQEQAAPNGFKITETSSLAAIVFQRTGVGSTQAEFKVCRQLPSVGSQERKVTVSATGRPKVERTALGSC